MKKFIRENWFKVTLSLAVFIIAVSIAFYLLVLLPKKNILIIEEQKRQVELQLEQQRKEFEIKQEVERQALQAELDQKEELANQQAQQEKIEQDRKNTLEKAKQDKQALIEQEEKEKEQNIKDCLSVANAIYQSAVEEYGYSEMTQKTYENMRNVCIQGN